MAGSLDSPSVIWVVGEATGKNVAGASAPLPSDTTPTALTLSYVNNIAASGVITHDKLVASGVLPSY